MPGALAWGAGLVPGHEAGGLQVAIRHQAKGNANGRTACELSYFTILTIQYLMVTRRSKPPSATSTSCDGWPAAICLRRSPLRSGSDPPWLQGAADSDPPLPMFSPWVERTRCRWTPLGRGRFGTGTKRRWPQANRPSLNFWSCTPTEPAPHLWIDASSIAV